jgi:hypothetical protein
MMRDEQTDVASARRRELKCGLSSQRSRLQRRETTVALSRSKRRKEVAQKRRRRRPVFAGSASTTTTTPPPPSSAPLAGAGGAQTAAASSDDLEIEAQRVFPGDACTDAEKQRLLSVLLHTRCIDVASNAEQLLVGLRLVRMIEPPIGLFLSLPSGLSFLLDVMREFFTRAEHGAENKALSAHDADVASRLQCEVAWILTNLASGDEPEHVRHMMSRGVGEVLMRVLEHSTSDSVVEHVVWAVGNLVGDSNECRDAMLRMRLLPVLRTRLEMIHASDELVRNGTWVLQLLCKFGATLPLSVVREVLHVLVHTCLRRDGDEAVLTDACWALSYLTASDPRDVDGRMLHAVVESNVCARLVALLQRATVIAVPALRTLGNLVAGNDIHMQAVLQCVGVLPAMRAMLRLPLASVRKDVAWTLSNIAAGSSMHIDSLVSSGLLLAGIDTLRNEASMPVRKELLYMVAGACTGGTDEHRVYMIRNDVVVAVASLVEFDDAEVLEVALVTLDRLFQVDEPLDVENGVETFEECGGLDTLCYVREQYRDNETIYDLANGILEKYYEDAENTDDDDTTLSTLYPSITMGGTRPSAPFQF